MLIAFELSMPQNNSWNGRWSGEARRYVKVFSFSATKKSAAKVEAMLARRSYSYNFGDGWCARVDVSVVDANEARKLRKVSAGFCGYDWMIESIRYDGEIYRPMRPKPEPAKQTV